MRPVSAAFGQAIAQPHTRVARVAVLNPDLSVASYLTGSAGVAFEGSVTTDSDRRRSCQLSVANPDGLWTPSGPADALYLNRLIRLERGILVDGAPEYVSLGVFLIDRPRISVGQARVTVAGQDRLKLAVRSRFTKPVLYEQGMPLADVVRAIAQDAGMGSTLYRLDDAGAGLRADIVFDTNAERVEAMSTLATDYGLELLVDADGYLVLRPSITSLASLPAPAWTFDRGADAIMLDVEKDFTDDRLYNHTLVTGEAADLPPVSAEARDLNPASPAYNPLDGSGPIGDRLYGYSSSFIRDEQQAQDVADALLLTVALVEESLSIPSVVHPALEAGDVVSIVESVSETNDAYIVDTLSIPLGEGSMTLTSRKVRSLTS